MELAGSRKAASEVPEVGTRRKQLLHLPVCRDGLRGDADAASGSGVASVGERELSKDDGRKTRDVNCEHPVKINSPAKLWRRA